MTSLGVSMSPDKLKSMIAEVEAIYHAYTHTHTHTLHTHTHTNKLQRHRLSYPGDETDFPEFCLMFFF